MRFDDDTALTEVAPGRFALDVSDGWGIYGIPNGGFLAALMGSALARALPHPDPFTLTCHYLRPAAPGPAEIVVEVLRAGRGHSTGTARLLRGGELVVHAVGTFGDLDARRGTTLEEPRMAALPPPLDCALRDGGPGGGSTFGERLEMRFVPETVPFLDGRTDEGPMVLGGWMRLADGRAPDARSLLLFADAMPPPTLRVVPRVWVPTLELTVHVRRRPRAGWIGGWFRTHHLIEGYLEEDGELYDEDGALCAVSRQLARVQLPRTEGA